MIDESPQAKDHDNNLGQSRWHALGWLMLGLILGLALLAAFLAYGQPELLLEQLNLRYCG